MSRALAFSTGIAAVVTLLWLLFTPGSDAEKTGIPVSGAVDKPDAPPAAPATGRQGPEAKGSQTADHQAADPASGADPSVSTELPARPRNPAFGAPPVVALWQAAPDAPTTTTDGFPTTRLQADPQALQGFHVGQQVELQIPELNRTVTARLASTHNQMNNIQVFKGPVSGGQESENVIVTRGAKSTYVVLSTNEGVYSAVINNRSGETVLTSEADIADSLAGQDDAIPVPGINQDPPEQ